MRSGRVVAGLLSLNVELPLLTVLSQLRVSLFEAGLENTLEQEAVQV